MADEPSSAQIHEIKYNMNLNAIRFADKQKKHCKNSVKREKKC